MFLHTKFGYPESLDYSILPGYTSLKEEQKVRVHAAFEIGYNHSKHLGVKIAVGTGFETAKVVLEQELNKKPDAPPEQPVPPSIFAGLDNCQ